MLVHTLPEGHVSRISVHVHDAVVAIVCCWCAWVHGDGPLSTECVVIAPGVGVRRSSVKGSRHVEIVLMEVMILPKAFEGIWRMRCVLYQHTYTPPSSGHTQSLGFLHLSISYPRFVDSVLITVGYRHRGGKIAISVEVPPLTLELPPLRWSWQENALEGPGEIQSRCSVFMDPVSGTNCREKCSASTTSHNARTLPILTGTDV